MQASQADLTPIAGEGSTQAVQQRPKPPAEKVAGTATQKTAEARTDTVKLSLYAQAKLMRERGDSITEIARNLGLDLKTVNSYFDIQGSGVSKNYTPSPANSAQTPFPQAPAASKTPVTAP